VRDRGTLAEEFIKRRLQLTCTIKLQYDYEQTTSCVYQLRTISEARIAATLYRFLRVVSRLVQSTVVQVKIQSTFCQNCSTYFFI